MKFLTAAGEQELERAVEAIEAVSSVEVVIAIRPRARMWLVQHAVVGIVCAIAMLAFTLYSPFEFPLWEILVLPIFAGVLGALVVEAVPPLYRFLAPPSLRYDHVTEAAYATFIEQGVHATRDRTGLLVYVALRERMVELVGDLEVVKRVGLETVAAWEGELEVALAGGAIAFGKAVAALAPALAERLPRAADDINELGNAVQPLSAPPRHRRALR